MPRAPSSAGERAERMLAWITTGSCTPDLPPTFRPAGTSPCSPAGAGKVIPPQVCATVFPQYPRGYQGGAP
jgi:hypothetical protein